MPSHVVYSNQIAPLLSILGKTLFEKGSLPFAKRVIVVPHDGMRQMLLSHLAMDKELSIAAGITVVPLKRFFAEVFPDFLFPSQIKLSIAIEEILLKRRGEALFAPVALYLSKGSPERAGALAKTLGALFTRYGIYGGKELETWFIENSWQQEVWKEVFMRWHYPQSMLPQVKNIPPIECHLFGFSFLPPLYLSFFKQLGATFYQLSPCAEFWEEIASEKELLFFTEKSGKTSYKEIGHPLLAHMGKQKRMQMRLFEKEGITPLTAYVTPKECALGHLQRDLLTLSSSKMAFADDSLQMHTTTSKAHAAQVLYHQLCDLLEKEPSLGREEILVLSPELEQYYPLIQQVFGRKESLLPYRIYGLNAPSSQDLFTAFLSLIQLIEKEFALQSVLDFLLSPLLKEKWTREEIEEIYGFCKKAHIKETLKEWERGLNSLLLGLAVYAEEGEFQGEIFPIEALSWQEAPLFERFFLFFTALQEQLTPLLNKEERNLYGWISYAEEVMGFFFEQSPPLYELKEALCPSSLEKVPFAAAAWLFKELCTHPPILSSKLHAITFAPLQSEYIQRAKVTVLLGMQEGVFPRQQKKNSLQTFFPKEEVSPALLDRSRFLDLLTQTTDYFWIHYVKNEDTEGPSPLLAELIECSGEIPLIAHTLPKIPKTVEQKIPFIVKKEEEHQETLSLERLRQLFRNPLKFYCERTLGIYLDTQEEEEFLFSPLEKALLRKKSQKTPLPKLVEAYALQGKLPKGLFEKMNVAQVEEEVTEYQKILEHLGVLRAPRYTIEFSNVCKTPLVHGAAHLLMPASHNIVGKLREVSYEGLFIHAKDSPLEWIRHFPEILLHQTLPEAFAKKIFFTKEGEMKAVTIPDLSFFIEQLFSYYQQALSFPHPFYPAWVEAFFKKRESLQKNFVEEEDPYYKWLLLRDEDLFKRESLWEEKLTQYFEPIWGIYATL